MEYSGHRSTAYVAGVPAEYPHRARETDASLATRARAAASQQVRVHSRVAAQCCLDRPVGHVAWHGVLQYTAQYTAFKAARLPGSLLNKIRCGAATAMLVLIPCV